MDKNNNILHRHTVVLNRKEYTIVTIDTAKQVRVSIAPASLDDELYAMEQFGRLTTEAEAIVDIYDYIVPDRMIIDNDIDGIVSTLLLVEPDLFVART